MIRTSLVPADDPLLAIASATPPTATATGPAAGAAAAAAGPSPVVMHVAPEFAASAAGAVPVPNPSTSAPAAAATAAASADPDDIIVDSERQRAILRRQERKEHTPLYVGGGGNSAAALTPATPATATSGLGAALAQTRAAAMAVGGSPPTSAAAATAAATSASHLPVVATASPAVAAATPASPAPKSAVVSPRSPPPRKYVLPLRSRDWHPSPELSHALCDDWDSHGRIPGEHSVMQIPDVLCYSAHDEPSQITHSLLGILFMTSYQLFLEPTQRRDRLGQAVMAIPLSTIERIEIDKNKPGGSGNTASNSSSSGSSSNSSSGGSGSTPAQQRHYLDVYSKDGRYLKLGFGKSDECKRAYDCLTQYVFPTKDEYMFAWAYKLKVPLPAHLDGWNVYEPLLEFVRQGIHTTPLDPPHNTTSTALRVSWVNENYNLCASYPRVLVVPSERFVSDVDLLVVAQFRSRGRIPVCTWKHPTGRHSIWRCSQPRVGINNTRCAEDEKLLHALTTHPGDQFAIFDARPRFNARANILAGKGFENPDLYRNAVKKIFFLDIHNIHVMRDSCAKMVRACAREAHNTHEGGNASFVAAVSASGWLSHIATCLKATAEMVKAVDQDKLTLLIHCSDGWDRTAQLSALVQLCVDPYYRTTRGFMVLVEKEWCSFGHQFARRTGHKDRNYSDDQRSCIFLQWLDCVHQLMHQFPRHFEFNSHLLVTLAHHLYSCRFGTFLFNSDLLRRKHKLREKTVSVWTYLMCSPAAIRGEFTNPLYCKMGNGAAMPTMPHATGAAATANGVHGHGHGHGHGTAAPAPSHVDEWGGRSSVGRGGGNGAASTIGAVLYPCWTQKCIRVWGDYFLRWINEQCEQVHVGTHAGSVAPGGAATPRMYSSDGLMQAEIRRVHREATEALRSQQAKHAEQVRMLEAEIARLKRSAAAEAAASAHTHTSVAPLFGSVDATGDLLFGREDPSISTSPLDAAAADADADADAAAASLRALPLPDAPGMSPLSNDDEATDSLELPQQEAAVLATLQRRLQSEVDVSVREEVEAPEDPRTL